MTRISFFLTLLFIITPATSLYAYIDPGLGSLIAQITTGTILVVVFGIKLFGYRIIGFLKKFFKKAKK
jgi:hypothetical protein